MPKKIKPKSVAPEVKLVTREEFEEALRKTLLVSKEESDEQMGRFQESNKARREASRKRG